MNYQEALNYLYGLSKFGSNLGLERVEAILARLGRPQERLSVAHIAGTNGKGSTAAMLASVLRAAGYRVGLYTSPHLSSYRERIQVDGRPISANDFGRLFGEIKPAVEGVRDEAGLGDPTEFETLTAAALYYFAALGLDLALMEVGLGGRLDATNVVVPRVGIITAISLEHTAVLGNTLAAIAREKAGIVKPGVPVVSAGQEPEAAAVIAACCQRRKAPLLQVGQDIVVDKVDLKQAGISFSCRGPGWQFQDLEISLMGKHQAENAALALGAVGLLRAQGYAIPPEKVRQGLAQVCWPGRMEVLPGSPDFLLDVAHNPQGTKVLAQAIGSHYPGRSILLVFGALADKDVKAMAFNLGPLARRVVVTRPNSPRAQEPEQVAKDFKGFCSRVDLAPGIAEAVDMAISEAGKEELIVICGSFYLVGEARDLLLTRIEKNDAGGL